MSQVTFPDFFLADQLTSQVRLPCLYCNRKNNINWAYIPLNLAVILLIDSAFAIQVQALRSLQFYICYYGWGDFKRRSNNCQGSDIYKILYIIVAVLPYWSRFLQVRSFLSIFLSFHLKMSRILGCFTPIIIQCIRRLVSERESKQGLNALKYLSTIVALVARTIYDQNRGTPWKIIAAATSGITTVYSTYWDIVIDWGLLRRNSRNRWLRDKLLLSNKLVYFVAMVSISRSSIISSTILPFFIVFIFFPENVTMNRIDYLL